MKAQRSTILYAKSIILYKTKQKKRKFINNVLFFFAL